MVTASKIRDCNSCKKQKTVSGAKKQVGLLTTILLIILPKCPFCLMAYSSTLMLCGEAGVVSDQITHTSSITIFILSLLCFVVLLSILLNYQGARTIYALLLTATGCFLIFYSACIRGGLPLYYSGISFLFIAMWLNANLQFLINRIIRKKTTAPIYNNI